MPETLHAEFQNRNDVHLQTGDVQDDYSLAIHSGASIRTNGSFWFYRDTEKDGRQARVRTLRFLYEFPPEWDKRERHRRGFRRCPNSFSARKWYRAFDPYNQGANEI